LKKLILFTYSCFYIVELNHSQFFLALVAPQETVDSRGATVTAMAMEESASLDTPGEEKEEEHEGCADTDCPYGLNPSSSSFTSPTTADIVPSDNNMHMVTYGLIVDDRTVDSTVVDEEREVVADTSTASSARSIVDSSNANSDSFEDVTDDGLMAERDDEDNEDVNDNSDKEKQVGDHS
jgi:hypothetical protein